MMKKSIGSGRGSVYNVLLKALQTGDKYAYEICKEIEEKTNGNYVLKEQSSYSGLRRLEQRNEITSYWKDSALGGRRHYYSLTEKGRQRLENSNFSWEDTRDEIVENLFEQSEVDKQINIVSQDLEDIKLSVSTQNQSDIDEIISKTDSLVKENDIENKIDNEDEEIDSQFEQLNGDKVFVSENEIQNNENESFENEQEESSIKQDSKENNQTDLFSIFADYSSNEENAEKKELTDNKKSVEADEITEQNDNEELFENSKNDNYDKYEQNSFDENLENKSEEINVDEEQINDNDDKNEIYENNDELLDSNPIPEIIENENKTEQFDDLFDINHISENDNDKIEQSKEDIEELSQSDIYQKEYDEHNDLTLNNESNLEDINDLQQTEQVVKDEAEEKNETKDIFDDVFKNLQTVGEKELNKENGFENINNKVQSLSKNDVDIDFYRQMHKSTNNYIDNTYQEKSNYNFFDDSKDDLISDSKENSDNTLLDDEYVDKISSSENDFYESKNISSDSENNQITENTKSIDYNDIFGDLVSKNNENNQFDASNSLNDNYEELPRNNQLVNEEKIESFNNNTSSIILGTKDENPIENNFDYTEQKNINDINRTLKSDGKSRIDEMYEMQNAYNENEKYDQNYYHNDYEYDSQEIDTINNVSFDKKYDNLENNFDVPNYKIRYQQKHLQKRQSRYLLSNKLNLIACLMLCLMLAVCNTITLLICKALGSPNSQIVFCNVCYILITAVLLFYLAKYIINPAKRTHNFNKYDLIVSASISAIILVFTFMINIWSGMTLSNLANYFASLIMPLFFAIALLLSHTAKKVLSKSSKFYK